MICARQYAHVEKEAALPIAPLGWPRAVKEHRSAVLGVLQVVEARAPPVAVGVHLVERLGAAVGEQVGVLADGGGAVAAHHEEDELRVSFVGGDDVRDALPAQGLDEAARHGWRNRDGPRKCRVSLGRESLLVQAAAALSCVLSRRLSLPPRPLLHAEAAAIEDEQRLHALRLEHLDHPQRIAQEPFGGRPQRKLSGTGVCTTVQPSRGIDGNRLALVP